MPDSSLNMMPPAPINVAALFSARARLPERVLWALREERRPIGVYQLAQKLTTVTGRRHHPNSIYRVLHTLNERRAVFNVASARGWIVRSLDDPGAAIILVCRVCGGAQQLPVGAVENDLAKAVSATRFKPSLYHVEVIGTCRACADPMLD